MSIQGEVLSIEREVLDGLDAPAKIATEWAKRWPVFIDTESTGMGDKDQVIEVSVLDLNGTVLLDTLVRPTVEVSKEARAVHGILDVELSAAPDWPYVEKQLRRLLYGRLIVAHHAAFDWRLLSQSSLAHGLPELPCAGLACTADLLAELNGGRWPRLNVAMQLVGAEPPEGQPHRALRDAEACRRVLRALVAHAGHRIA